MHLKKLTLTATLLIAAITQVNASIITDNFTGTVTSITGFTPFTTVHLGDTVTGSLTYDSLLASGPDANGNLTITGADPNASFLVNGLVGVAGLGVGALYSLTFTPTGTPVSLSAGTTGPVYAFGANSVFTFANDTASPGAVTVSFAPRATPEAGSTLALLGFALTGLAGFRRFVH